MLKRVYANQNLRETVEGYVESVVRDGEEDDFIPRAIPEKMKIAYIYDLRRFI